MSNKKSLKLPEIEILYEDSDCVVLNKPPALMVHSDGRDEGPFLTDWIVKHYPEAKKVGETITSADGEILERPGIVHRLDRDTSGAIIIAKTPAGHAFLKEQFQARTITKKYLAVVWGDMREEFGTVSLPIGHSVSDFRKWSAERKVRGEAREAETYWTLLAKKKFGEGPETQHFSLIQAEPKTGRTHQIRVHMKALQHPVVGDSLYAETKPLALGFKRLALHSWSISFLAKNGKTVTVKAPLPADFKKALKELDFDPKKLV